MEGHSIPWGCADRQVSHLISNYTIPHNTTALCDMPFHVATQTNDASYFTLSYTTTLYDMSCATQDAVLLSEGPPSELRAFNLNFANTTSAILVFSS